MTTQRNTTRGRPRNQASREAILQAAFQLAHERGYRHVSLLDIAAAANVGRQTIYRWWPSKRYLYMEMLTWAVETSMPQTAQNEVDLYEYLCFIFQVAREKTGTITLELLLDAQHDPALLAELAMVLGERRRLLRGAIERFAAEQNRSLTMPAELIAEMIAGTMWYRLLQANAPNEVLAKQLTEVVQKLLVGEGER